MFHNTLSISSALPSVDASDGTVAERPLTAALFLKSDAKPGVDLDVTLEAELPSAVVLLELDTVGVVVSMASVCVAIAARTRMVVKNFILREGG
jgi:hypothetical protein